MSRQPMISPSASLLFVILGLACGCIEPSPAPARARNPTRPILTTESPVSPVLEDPNNPATTSDNSDDVCVRCLDAVIFAQEMVDVYDNIVQRQKKLIDRKKAAAEAAIVSASSNANGSRRSNKVQRSPNNNSNIDNSTVRSRTLANQPELIVVSRLRVARSSTSTDKAQSRSKEKYWLNKKDLELERLKNEQQLQKDITCKSLLSLRTCLDRSNRECIGNLLFHSFEVFSDQLYERLLCPYPNNPNIKPLPGIFVRTISDDSKMPIARPITSPEEVRKRLKDILPDRVFPRPMGVMLKPTMPNNVQQQYMRSAGQPEGSYRLLTQPQYTKSDNSWTVSKVLLIPGSFAILVALVASLFYKKPIEEEDKVDKVEHEFC